MMSNVSTEELLSLFNKLSIKEREFKKRKERLRSMILKRMSDNNCINAGNYNATLKTQTRHTISKNDLPEEIWNKHKREISYKVLRVTKIEELDFTDPV